MPAPVLTRFLLVAALLALAVTAAPAQAAPPPVFAIEHGAFSGPSALAVGPDGSIWAAHATPLNTPRYATAIARLDPGGRHKLIRVPGATTSIAVLRDGTVAAVARTGRTVILVSPRGRVSQVEVPGQDLTFNQVVAGPDGNAWVLISTFEGDGTVLRVTPSGRSTAFSVPPTPRGAGEPIDPSPNSIAAGPDGRLWITVDGAVDAVTTDGEFEIHPLPDVPVADQPGAGLPAIPRTIVAGPDDTMWILRDEGVLDRMRTDGTLLAPVRVPGAGTEALDALGIGPGGDVFLATGSKLRRLTPDGVAETVTLTARDYQRTQTASPQGLIGQIAPGPGGSLWLAANLHDGGTGGGIAVVNFGERCFVPRLENMLLSEARKELLAHGCRLGSVRRTGRRSPIDAVVCTSARQGRVLGRHGRVGVTLSASPTPDRRLCRR